MTNSKGLDGTDSIDLTISMGSHRTASAMITRKGVARLDSDQRKEVTSAHQGTSGLSAEQKLKLEAER